MMRSRREGGSYFDLRRAHGSGMLRCEARSSRMGSSWPWMEADLEMRSRMLLV